MTSSLSDQQVTCDDPSIASIIARNLHTRTDFVGLQCNGKEFSGEAGSCQNTGCGTSGDIHDYEFWSRPVDSSMGNCR